MLTDSLINSFTVHNWFNIIYVIWSMEDVSIVSKKGKDNLLDELAKSLIWIKNNKEPEVDTCGTPQAISWK